MGLSLADDNLEAERDQLHFGLFDADGELVGCIVVLPLPAGGTSLSPGEGRGLPQTHHALRSSERATPCSSVPAAPREARLRRMAVARHFQGRGHGRRIIEEVERALAARGFTQLVLHVRNPVVPFYEKLGYRVVGAEFIEVTIPHVQMEKTLASRK